MSELRVLSQPQAVQAAFEAACDWCSELAFATPAAASASRKWPLWAALERNASKVKAAYVALDGLRTEPAALAWLQDQDCLRFVPAADGSFRANVYRFRRGDDVRVLMGAGQFGPAGLMAPVDAMLLWHGTALDGFAASIEAVLQQARAKAHVPSGDELSDYSRAFYAAAELWDQLHELGAPFIRSTARDAEVPELEVVVDPKAIRSANNTMREQLSTIATEPRRQKIGYHGGNQIVTIHWCPSLKLWAFFKKLDNRYWNSFGISRPNPDKALQITVEVNPPLEGLDRKMGGAFASDPHTGDIYLVHRGRIGGGQKGIGAELFWSRFRGGVRMREPDREEPSRVVIVGKVGDEGFPRDLAGFVHEVARIKAAG